jgi:hypothetical protein
MNMTIISEPALPATSVKDVGVIPPHAQPACLQEQFTGPLPERRERSLSEILAERMAEAGPAGACPLFIP